MYKVFITIKLNKERYPMYNKVATYVKNANDEIAQAKKMRVNAVKGRGTYRQFKNRPALLSWAIYKEFTDTVPWARSTNWQD